MFNIRFHGRGGQGMKTAGRILGTAFFLEGFEVQDAPRYGAERRGAPMSAYVRASLEPIFERGVITTPNLVVVADDSLVAIPSAGVMAGISDSTVLLIATHETEQTWRSRLNLKNPIIILTPDEKISFISAACAGAAAKLSGRIGRETLLKAIAEEFSDASPEILDNNRITALHAFDLVEAHQGAVVESTGEFPPDYSKPSWIDLKLEKADSSSPTIHGALTSVMVKTGLWRTQRPIIDYDLCHHCWWVCSSFCPDSVIHVGANGIPEIDYEHCKGCLVCVAQCPSHAIFAMPEALAQQEDQKKRGEKA
ncbi:MAG: 2-oxoacid:acceptor oxidoreductase family protein [Gammaproteobacteria bacterium]